MRTSFITLPLFIQERILQSVAFFTPSFYLNHYPALICYNHTRELCNLYDLNSVAVILLMFRVPNVHSYTSSSNETSDHSAALCPGALFVNSKTALSFFSLDCESLLLLILAHLYQTYCEVVF